MENLMLKLRCNISDLLRCVLPPFVGHCEAAFKSWFYNVTSQKCESYLYGGCGADNKVNMFATKTACLSICGKYIEQGQPNHLHSNFIVELLLSKNTKVS